jgi:pimeloyl-ACP methyl ester carboxylesterase
MMTSQRSVVVIPARNFGPYAPQLFFPMFAAIRRGAEPVVIEWQDVENVDALESTDVAGWVSEQIGSVITHADPRSTLVIAKSLGSFAAARIGDLALPAIWVTPVLTNPAVVESLRLATAPFLLIGGSSDELWNLELAESLTPHVLEIPGADHGLFVPGPLSRSAQNIGLVAEASETFIDRQVWPD